MMRGWRCALGRAAAVGMCAIGSAALGCASWRAPAPTSLTSLAVSVADLELHLRDDSYRSFAHLTADGRNVFEITRWQLERLQRQRSADPAAWSPDDYVLEFARARTLERLHLYRSAADSYHRVASRDSRVAPFAARAAEVMDRFAALARPLEPVAADEELAEIDARIASWTELAQNEADPAYASLAREEAESWEILRVEFFARERGSDEAIAACDQLIQRHRPSKFYPQHLLRLGDLHLASAQHAVVRARAERTDLADTAYQQHFEAALSAYELASEARNAVLRREAQSRLQALLTYHDGVRSGVY